MILFDIIIVMLVLFIGFNFRNQFAILDAYDRLILKKLFYYHFFFGVVFFAYISKYTGDSTNYWFVTFFDDFDYNDVVEIVSDGSVTGYMLLLNYFPAKFLGLSYFAGTIIYALLGYMGFVFFYLILKTQINNWDYLKSVKILRIKIFPIFLFIPNIHFWTAGVSKDTLIFFSIAWFAYSTLNIKRSVFGIVIPLIITFFIRPHITLFMVTAFGMGFFFDGKRKTYQKVLVILIFVIGFGMLLSKVQQFVNIENFETDSIEAFSSKSAENLSSERVGSAVDISNYPLPLKIFTFLYRPLFMDGFSPLNIISSFENLLILLFTIKIIRSKPINGFGRSSYIIKGFLFFLIMGSIAFSMILGNLGIMMRQKTPFIVALLLFGFFVINESKEIFKRN